LLVGDSRAVSEALTLLATQDRLLRTVVLRYDTKRVRDLEAQGFVVSWTARSGDLRIGSVRPSPGSGTSVDVRADAAMERLADSFTGTMRVSEGSSTRIETGTSVPFTTPSRRGPSTQVLTAATGFEARARILGDGRVQVDLAPFAGRLAPLTGAQTGERAGAQTGEHGVETLSASTQIVVTPGETLVVGGIGGASQQRQRSLQGASSESTGDDTVLVLRADVEL